MDYINRWHHNLQALEKHRRDPCATGEPYNTSDRVVLLTATTRNNKKKKKERKGATTNESIREKKSVKQGGLYMQSSMYNLAFDRSKEFQFRTREPAYSNIFELHCYKYGKN